MLELQVKHRIGVRCRADGKHEVVALLSRRIGISLYGERDKVLRGRCAVGIVGGEAVCAAVDDVVLPYGRRERTCRGGGGVTLVVDEVRRQSDGIAGLSRSVDCTRIITDGSVND